MRFTFFAALAITSSLLMGVCLLPAHAEERGKGSLAGPVIVVDPGGDCDVLLKREKLTIVVPPTNHNLHPIRGMNAPRVLKRISGDFTIQVKVSGKFEPGTISTKPQGQGRPFNGAGILIWENGNNYLRVERNAYWVEDVLYNYPPLIEYWRDRKDEGVNTTPTPEPYFTGDSAWLKARRHGGEMTISTSHDGEEWSVVKTFQINMGDKLSAGVAAINSSNEPFTVDFTELKIDSE